MGIDCERCHGPGQLHVERWGSAKERPTGALDPTIVNPRRLPLERRINVCFQCHLGDAKAGERVPRHDRQLEEFRPGFLLTDVSVPFEYEQALEVDYGLSAQADRLLRSRCYLASGGKIECLTCHNPHVTTYDESRTADFYRGKCLGCHDLDSCKAPESARQATVPRDDCVRCHMRKAEPDDHRHTLFTDHWIRRRMEPADSHARTSIDFAPVFPATFASLPPEEQAFYRGRINLLKALETPPAVRSAMLHEAVTSFRKAIEGGFAKADAWYFLGKALIHQRRWNDAVAALRDAVRRDPEHRDAAFNLGQTLLQQARIAEAAEVYEGMLKRNARDPGALAELGRCRLAARRAAEGLELYDLALAEEPNNARLQANRAVVLLALGRPDDAAEAALESTRLAPNDASVWKACTEVLARAGRLAEAAEAERRTLALSRRRADETIAAPSMN
jgi:tetratricopeptide (TPR) repeat protein